MRICFLALGKFAHVDAYLDYFEGRGHEVHFVALAPGPRRRVPTHDVSSNTRAFKLPGKFSYLPSIVRARKVVRRLSPDIVHAHYATSAGLAAYVCNVHPWVVTAHGTDVTMGVRSPLWRRLLKTICRHADCINVVSNDLRDKVISLGTPVDKIELFSVGIDTKIFRFTERPFSKSPQARFICTRRFEPVYDHATILKGMAVLRKRGINFVLTLVGDGVSRPGLEALAIDLGISDQVTFAGAVPNNLLPEILTRHDIYLSASTRDGASLCLLEAMAAGLYPVVSDIPANTEWVEHRKNGLLHRVSDPQGLADCIGELLNGLGGINAALRQNRELVERRGDRAANMLRLEQIYRGLADKLGPVKRSPNAILPRGSTFHSN